LQAYGSDRIFGRCRVFFVDNWPAIGINCGGASGVDCVGCDTRSAARALWFMERSLVILKPDCVGRGLIGEVIGRFERAGMSIAACRAMVLGDEILAAHYAHLAHLPFFPEIVQFMSSDRVLVMVLEGENAVARIRSLLGPTDSQKAPAGTIRGDFGLDKMRNVAHASDSSEVADVEIVRFFG
jgi:nucleoside-diphosphate kinase